MSVRYFCDRCDRVSATPFRQLQIRSTPRSALDETADLCDTCLSDLRSWLQPINGLATRDGNDHGAAK